MGHSIFLAKIIGPYCIIVAVAFLFNRQNYQKVAEAFLSSDGLRCLGAMIGLLIGLLLVNTHNVWETSWVTIITVIGWIALIKGITLFIFPDQFTQFANAYRQKSTLLKYQLSLTLLFGVFLSFKGYCS